MTITKPNRHADGAECIESRRRMIDRMTTTVLARIRHCCRREEGSTIAEMALVLPILLVVLTGVFSFGIALNQYLVLTNAVNNAARAFAMSAPAKAGGSAIVNSGDPCQYTAQSIHDSATNMNGSNISYTITYVSYGGDATKLANNTPTSTITKTGSGTTYPSCSALAMYQYDYVTVQAVYPVTPPLFGWVSRSLSLTASSTEMVQ